MSHNIKPGRRRSSLRMVALLACVVVFSMFAQAHAASLHQGRIDHMLRAIIARQDPLSGNSPSSTSPPSTTAQTHTKSSATQHSKTDAPSSSSTPTASSSGNGTTTSAPTQQLTALPKAFDTIISNNFTNPACAKFLEGLSTNSSFTNCLPLSIIMQSQSFFEDSMTKSLLDEVLDATCNVDLGSCQNLMQNLAQQLRTTQYCEADYNLENPAVLEAYYGFISYTPLYYAGCLKTAPASATTASDSSGSGSEYCYTSTTTNGTGDLNGYVYSLPLGTALPSSGTVNCSTCLQQTMGFFAGAASNASSPMSTLYNNAAKEINAQCGANWVRTNITVDKSTQTSGAQGTQNPLSMTMILAACIVLMML